MYFLDGGVKICHVGLRDLEDHESADEKCYRCATEPTSSTDGASPILYALEKDL
jgi:hypothetical protein